MNLLTVSKTFQTEDAALDYLVTQRWPRGVRCLGCDCAKVYRIDTKGKTGRPYRKYECSDCGLHFSATTGTLFHDSHLPLQKWFMAMALMAEAKKGISANQIARHLGVQYKTAWHLCHRIRKAMQEIAIAPLGGQGQIVEVDETFIGGKKLRKGVKAGKDAKISVLGMVERGGRLHMQSIENCKVPAIRPVLEANLSPNVKTVLTDSASAYSRIIPKDKHVETNHRLELETFGELSTRTIEGAFSLFKRGVIGSFHHMSKDHLDSYLQEFCWRYNRRKQQAGMFGTLTRELVTKKPLTYKTLTRDIF